jgi:hypothetical protein
MTTQTEVELEMVETQQWVSRYEALQRLEKNADFINVISEGYIRDRALNGVSMLANEGVKRQGQRGDIMEMLVAVSALQDYFGMLKNLGAIAKDDMDEETGPLAE